MSRDIALNVIVRFRCERTLFASHIEIIYAENLRFGDVL